MSLFASSVRAERVTSLSDTLDTDGGATVDQLADSSDPTVVLKIKEKPQQSMMLRSFLFHVSLSDFFVLQ